MGAAYVDKVKMALAEAGYPDAQVFAEGDGDASVILSGEFGVPDRACWMAHRVAGGLQCCWQCWLDGWPWRECTDPTSDDCGRDRS